MFTLHCDAITQGGSIPQPHLGPGHGDNMAPHLAWHGEPDDTRAFALTLTDHDAPGYQHWLVVLDASSHELSALQTPAAALVGQGTRFMGYEGPCPPDGEHHYVFTLHALSEAPDLAAGFTVEELSGAIEGTVLATATLEASYAPSPLHVMRRRGGRVVARVRSLGRGAPLELAA